MKGSDSRGNRGNAGVACIAGRGGRVVHQKIRAGVGFAQGGRGHLRRDLPDRAPASGPSDTEIKLGEQVDEEPYIALIKRLAVKDKLDFDTAKLLINEYKKLREGNK